MLRRLVAIFLLAAANSASAVGSNVVVTGDVGGGKLAESRPIVPGPVFRPGPPVSSLPFSDEDSADALQAFVQTCPALVGGDGRRGILRGADWMEPCAAAREGPAADAPRFFAKFFTAVQLHEGEAFVTGYYEPEIAASLVPRPGYTTAIYRFPANPASSHQAEAPFLPLPDRRRIEAGALAGRGLEIAWAADPIELFFLQIQGSGRLRLPDGGILHIGYAGHNGHSYVSLGALLRAEGILGQGQGQYPATMQGIMAFLRDHPQAARGWMERNPRWVFFRVLEGDGPIGTLGVPLRAGSSIAVDPLHVPLGAPIWLDLDRDGADGLWIAQDTGGAIKGPNRFDSFWGAGNAARVIAGSLQARGIAYVLLPNASASRLGMRP